MATLWKVNFVISKSRVSAFSTISKPSKSTGTMTVWFRRGRIVDIWLARRYSQLLNNNPSTMLGQVNSNAIRKLSTAVHEWPCQTQFDHSSSSIAHSVRCTVSNDGCWGVGGKPATMFEGAPPANFSSRFLQDPLLVGIPVACEWMNCMNYFILSMYLQVRFMI